jgi:Cu/Ag efflux pump CusA
MFKWLLDNSLANRLLVIIASLVLMAYGAFTSPARRWMCFRTSTSRRSPS